MSDQLTHLLNTKHKCLDKSRSIDKFLPERKSIHNWTVTFYYSPVCIISESYKGSLWELICVSY